MKHILTNKNNKIIEISNTYELDEEHRNINVDNHAIAYGPDEKINVYEIPEIPEGVETAKYCYTEEKGFYKNENYVEPIDENAELKQVKQELADTQMALAELYEMFIESEV